MASTPTAPPPTASPDPSASGVASGPIRVHPVSSRADRRAFIDLGYRLYDGVSAFVPPLRQEVKKTLDPKKNPFFEHGRMQLFLARDAQDQVVGRIGAIINGMHLNKYEDATGFFGFFECVDDFAVARALLTEAEAWLRAQGMRRVRGPANPSLNDTCGLLVDGFERPPFLLMPYNPPYYESLLARWGFETAMTMWAYYVHEKYVQTDKLKRGAQIVYRRNPGLQVRTLNLDRLYEEAELIRDIYNDAWSDNWGHVPMTEAELRHLVDDLKQIVDKEIVYILEDAGTPVAFAISLPNLNQALSLIPDGRLFPTGLLKLLVYGDTVIDEIRMPLMGVRRAYHGRGLDAILILETIERGTAKGYHACEMSWVLDANKVLINALDALGGVRDKRYVMLEKTL
ncbi:MAG: hypothetical protein AAGI71_02415 [Bacteroidota bacterium]